MVMSSNAAAPFLNIAIKRAILEHNPEKWKPVC
jgi:hypothetical protein